MADEKSTVDLKKMPLGSFKYADENQAFIFYRLKSLPATAPVECMRGHIDLDPGSYSEASIVAIATSIDQACQEIGQETDQKELTADNCPVYGFKFVPSTLSADPCHKKSAQFTLHFSGAVIKGRLAFLEKLATKLAALAASHKVAFTTPRPDTVAYSSICHDSALKVGISLRYCNNKVDCYYNDTRNLLMQLVTDLEGQQLNLQTNSDIPGAIKELTDFFNSEKNIHDPELDAIISACIKSLTAHTADNKQAIAALITAVTALDKALLDSRKRWNEEFLEDILFAETPPPSCVIQ